MAPPGPRLADLPWLRMSLSLGPSLHDVPSDDEYICTRGTIDDWEHVRYGFRHVSPPRPIHTRRRTHSYMGVALCLFLETIHTRIDFVMILREPTHTCVPLGIIRLSERPCQGAPRSLLS